MLTCEKSKSLRPRASFFQARRHFCEAVTRRDVNPCPGANGRVHGMPNYWVLCAVAIISSVIAYVMALKARQPLWKARLREMGASLALVAGAVLLIIAFGAFA